MFPTRLINCELVEEIYFLMGMENSKESNLFSPSPISFRYSGE